jgi:hypothetical protein
VSKVAELEDVTGATREGLTIMVVAAEVIASDGNALSVTRSSKDQLPIFVSEPVKTDEDESQADETPNAL